MWVVSWPMVMVVWPVVVVVRVPCWVLVCQVMVQWSVAVMV